MCKGITEDAQLGVNLVALDELLKQEELSLQQEINVTKDRLQRVQVTRQSIKETLELVRARVSEETTGDSRPGAA